jgi:hypothetical protein
MLKVNGLSAQQFVAEQALQLADLIETEQVAPGRRRLFTPEGYPCCTLGHLIVMTEDSDAIEEDWNYSHIILVNDAPRRSPKVLAETLRKSIPLLRKKVTDV